MLLIPYQLFNHPPTTPTTLLTCCKFWLVINSIAVHVTLFTSGLFFFVTALPMHKAHVRTSSTIQEALHKVARWPAVNVDFTQKAVKYTPLPAEKEVLDHTWRGTHWTYVTLWFASRGVRRDVTRFKTCDTLPVRDTLTLFTAGQVFRVKRDVILHTEDII